MDISDQKCQAIIESFNRQLLQADAGVQQRVTKPPIDENELANDEFQLSCLFVERLRLTEEPGADGQLLGLTKLIQLVFRGAQDRVLLHQRRR